MKDDNAQLKIQAYLDGELRGAEARQVEQWLAEEEGAHQLFGELTALRSALRGNEPEVKLPVPQELYWSQIERAIAREEAAPAPQTAEWVTVLRSWLRRYIAPVAAVAAVAMVAVGVGRFLSENPARHYVEIVNYSDDVNVSSFRSASEKMFVVWISQKETPAAVDLGEEVYQ